MQETYDDLIAQALDCERSARARSKYDDLSGAEQLRDEARRLRKRAEALKTQ